MQRGAERLPILSNPALRAGAAGLAMLLAGCSLQPVSPETDKPAKTAAAVPFDSCALYSQDAKAIMPFDGQKLLEQDTSYPDTGVKADIMLAAFPDAKPYEFMERYAKTRQEVLRQGGIKLVIDPLAVPAEWEPDNDNYQHSGLIRGIDGILDLLAQYPTGIFPKLGVKTIRLADDHKGVVAGSYSKSKDEIQIEYNKGEKTPLSIGGLPTIIAHETGHAIHDKLCGGNDTDDIELSKGITFIGPATKDANEEETRTHDLLVPKNQLAYGPSRVFPRAYSATSVQEYFATMVEYTLEERGLIQPGDADYQSPLYEKQLVVVSRLEKLFPGFKDFAQKQTEILRMNPQNEIYTNAPHVKISMKEVLQDLARQDVDDSLVLNGFFVLPNYGGRGGDISIFPRITEAYDGIKVWLEQFDDSEGSGSYMELESDDNETNSHLFFEMPGAKQLLVSKSRVEDSLGTYGVEPHTGHWSGDPTTNKFIQTIVAQGAKPVIVEFTN